MADKTFWTGLFAGAAVGFVAYKMIGGANKTANALVSRGPLPPQLAARPQGLQGQSRPYPSTLHGIPTVPLPASSMAHTRMARPSMPPPPPPSMDGSSSNKESFGGSDGNGMGGMGGETF